MLIPTTKRGIRMVKLKKQERQSSLESHISDDPFLTDEQLANIFGVSIQTIRLDRLELNIPELRARIKNVAREGVDKIRSLSIQEVVGEIIDIELNKSALSLFIVEDSQVFEKNQIARGHFLLAQANSLCVALIDEPLALTEHAAVDFKRPAKLNDKVVAKAKVTTMDDNTAHIEVESQDDGKELFTGNTEMYFKNEGEETMARIAVDLMGGDNAPKVIEKGVLQAADTFDDVEILAFGMPGSYSGNHPRVTFIEVTEKIESEDDPVKSVRRKKDSSLVRAVKAVADGEADAVVSAGNTGAIMSAGLFGVKRIKGIERPAITTMLPTTSDKGM